MVGWGAPGSRGQLPPETPDDEARRHVAEQNRKRHRLSPAALLTAAPAYAAAAALFLFAAMQFLGATQPGETVGDMRPMGHAANSLAALVGGVALVLLGYFAAKRPAEGTSLLTTLCIGALGALLLLRGASRGHSAVLLALGLAFAYAAVVALVRYAGLRRRKARERRT